MFYTKFVKLCNERNISPSAVAEQIGLSRAANTKWGAGQIPRKATMQKIADYFEVPISYFYDETEEKEKAPVSNKKTETLLKLIEMLTPENQDRLIDSISEMLKEQ